VLGARC